MFSRSTKTRSLWDVALPAFIKCLESLLNLHTLGIEFVKYYPRAYRLENALKGIKLSKIKTLVLPPVAHPPLKHCPNGEGIKL